MIHNHEVPGSIPGPATKKGGHSASFLRRRDHGLEPEEEGATLLIPFLFLIHSVNTLPAVAWRPSGTAVSLQAFARSNTLYFRIFSLLLDVIRLLFAGAGVRY